MAISLIIEAKSTRKHFKKLLLRKPQLNPIIPEAGEGLLSPERRICHSNFEGTFPRNRGSNPENWG